MHCLCQYFTHQFKIHWDSYKYVEFLVWVLRFFWTFWVISSFLGRYSISTYTPKWQRFDPPPSIVRTHTLATSPPPHCVRTLSLMPPSSFQRESFQISNQYVHREKGCKRFERQENSHSKRFLAQQWKSSPKTTTYDKKIFAYVLRCVHPLPVICMTYAFPRAPLPFSCVCTKWMTPRLPDECFNSLWVL